MIRSELPQESYTELGCLVRLPAVSLENPYRIFRLIASLRWKITDLDLSQSHGSAAGHHQPKPRQGYFPSAPKQEK